MTTEEKINIDNNWKEFAKFIVDKAPNYNEFQKEILKSMLDRYHECKKDTMIKNDIQANIILGMIEDKEEK